MSRTLLAAVAALAAAIGAGGTWLVERSGGGADQARIEGVVHDYMLDHPEIIPEAMGRLQDRETGKVVAANRAAIVTPYAGAWAGNPKGDVTLVEYYDYNCGFCRASLPTIATLIAHDPKLRVVYRELPVLAESSRDAARASLAAAAQGKFARFHQALYAAGPVTPQTIAAAAAAAGVDAAHPPADADGQIRDNLVMAGRLGMTGTPSWVVGDRVLSGAQSLDALQKAVATARAG